MLTLIRHITKPPELQVTPMWKKDKHFSVWTFGKFVNEKSLQPVKDRAVW